jgi:hypothetical protein
VKVIEMDKLMTKLVVMERDGDAFIDGLLDGLFDSD